MHTYLVLKSAAGNRDRWWRIRRLHCRSRAAVEVTQLMIIELTQSAGFFSLYTLWLHALSAPELSYMYCRTLGYMYCGPLASCISRNVWSVAESLWIRWVSLVSGIPWWPAPSCIPLAAITTRHIFTKTPWLFHWYKKEIMRMFNRHE